jgi:predicted nuclease of predicted toxin-antitoxin system
MRFLLDEDLSQRVAEGLRVRGVDTISVHEVGRGNRRIPDEQQLVFATDQSRVLVTYNRADFQALDAEFRRTGRPHPHAGILWYSERIIPRRAFGELIRAIEAVAATPVDLTNLCLPLQRSSPAGSREDPPKRD